MPHLKLFHFDIPTWGNYGDKALFPVVGDAFRVLGPGGAGITTDVAQRAHTLAQRIVDTIETGKHTVGQVIRFGSYKGKPGRIDTRPCAQSTAPQKTELAIILLSEPMSAAS